LSYTISLRNTICVRLQLLGRRDLPVQVLLAAKADCDSQNFHFLMELLLLLMRIANVHKSFLSTAITIKAIWKNKTVPRRSFGRLRNGNWQSEV
jgi:hypothetical protein